MRLEALGTPFSCGAARLFGSAAACPDQPWADGDGFHVILTFTFTPVVPESPALESSGTEVDSTLVLPPEPDVMPDGSIPAGSDAEPDSTVNPDPVITPDPILTPDPIVTLDPTTTPEPAVLPEPVPETIPDETTVPVPDNP